MDRGFTLVELVVVILVLAILAAVALPRFLDVSTEARVASLASLRGSLLEGARIAHVDCRLLRDCDSPGFSPVAITSPDGNSGRMFNGYPTSNASAFASHITRWVQIDGFTVDTASVFFTDFESQGAPNPDACKARYVFAQTQESGPTVQLFTDGC